MNKKFLSVAAASVLAAGLIGCGGGSSSSSTNNGSQPTQVKGVDGYIMNTKVTVRYWDKDKNITVPKTVDVSKSYFLTVDTATNKARTGKPIYSLADLNSTVLNNVVSVVMASQAQGKSPDGSVYSQSFFDADQNGELNTTIDTLIPAGVSFKAPKGYSVITPISTIIANQVEAKLTADKNETNLTNVVDAYTKDIAKALGVDASTIKNVDPLTLVNSTDEKAQAYVVANAFAGAMIANGNTAKVFKSLKAAKPATSAIEVIGNLATAANAAGDTKVEKLLTQVKSLIKTDKTNLATLVKSNLDKTRRLSIKHGGDLSIVALEGTAKDFNITSMTNYVGGNGYKIATSELDDINITLDPNDKNITNKKFTFVIRVADPKQFNAQDSNVSSLTVKVPFEVNSTDGSIDAAIPADAKVTFEGMSQDGSKIISGETNSTIFGNGNAKGGEILSVSGNTITIKAKTLIDDVDSNKSNAFFGGGLPSDIAEIQAGIVTDAAAGVDSDGNYILSGKDSILSVGGTINETVDSMISFNTQNTLVADMRAGVTTGANKAPNNDLNMTSFNHNQPNKTLANTTPSVGSDTNDTKGRVIVNNNQALDINLTKSSVDTEEENTTVSFTLGDYLTDKNLTTVSTKLKADSASNAVATNAIDVNTTSTDEKNLTTFIKYNVCDEFGDCNLTTAYLVVNRKPIYSTSEYNKTTQILFKDLDGFGDINVTGNYVTVLENNGIELNLSNVFKEVNVTSNNGGDAVKAKLSKISNGKGGYDLAIEFNTTMPTHIKYAETNDWNLSVSDYNETDGYINNNKKTSDTNLTIK